LWQSRGVQMIMENNSLILISEVNRRRIIPILNRVLKRIQLKLHHNTHEQLTNFILKNLPDSIIDESDRNLFYQVSKLITTDSAIDILDDQAGKRHLMKNTKQYFTA